ncbi:MAG: DUF2520 domain-containing protein [Deltaproteobacteria bacterium]|nr:DUF2520 domain-containing protein [Deltaproteobacteria bacterium]
MAESLQLLVIGGGRLGATLARDLARADQVVVAVVRRRARAQVLESWWAAQELAVAITHELPRGRRFDAVLAAVPDGQLAVLAEDLAQAAPLAPVYLHLSGVAPARQLARAEHAEVACGSLHPLAAVADPLTLRDPSSALRGALMAVGGDAPAQALARQLAEQLGGTPQFVADDQRPAYHAAAALIANDWVALAVAAEAALAKAGLLDPEFRRGLLHLAVTALAALQRLPAETPLLAGLTGAVARGDADTLIKHLAVLPPDAAALHRQASRLLAERSADLGRLTPAQKRAVLAALDAESENQPG